MWRQIFLSNFSSCTLNQQEHPQYFLSVFLQKNRQVLFRCTLSFSLSVTFLLPACFFHDKFKLKDSIGLFSPCWVGSGWPCLFQKVCRVDLIRKQLYLDTPADRSSVLIKHTVKVNRTNSPRQVPATDRLLHSRSVSQGVHSSRQSGTTDKV